MSLVKADSKTVAKYSDKGLGHIHKQEKNVLDEETYTDNIEKIIQRDFYPDLPKLKAQAEYLEAVEKNDLVKLRELQIKYGSKRPATNTPSLYNTPVTFETPEPGQRQSPIRREEKTDKNETESDGVSSESQNPEKPPANKQGLDKFLSKNTSEDNASFAEILVESEKKLREKNAWMFEREDQREEEQEKKLALPSVEEQAAIELTVPSGVQTWQYVARNHLMYVPKGEEWSNKELMELKKLKPREISHENTRFQESPFDSERNKQMLREAATVQAINKQGKIGADGKEILPAPSPQVNGYGFVGTPSPVPGVDASPLMTWGEIEGTPFRLDASDTPIPKSTGPSFKIPEVPKRDRIALELAEKASKQHRHKKQEALKRVTASFSSPVPKFGMSTSDRISSMSPAAQRLASSKLGIRSSSDKALRASYTPSPTHRLPGQKTPVLITSPGSTPKSVGTRTPDSTSERTLRRPGSDVTSLTDNLLNLPKRARAAEFF